LFLHIAVMNLNDKILTLEELGWTDPEVDQKEGIKKTIEWLCRLDFYNYVYPNDKMDVF